MHTKFEKCGHFHTGLAAGKHLPTKNSSKTALLEHTHMVVTIFTAGAPRHDSYILLHQ